MMADTLSGADSLKGRRIFIYGCGRLGKQVHAHLRKHGFTAAAFIDKDSKTIGAFEGTPVITLENIGAEHEDAVVIFAILSPYIDNKPIIDALKKRGVRQVMNMVDFISAFPDDSFTWFWLGTRESMHRQEKEYSVLATMLADDKSRQVVESIYAFRTSGDCSALPAPDAGEYFPADVPRWKDPIRFIDCGAFTGDTIQGLMNEGYRIEQALALEPDADNFNKLAAALPGVNVINIPCGAAQDVSQFRFDDGMGTGSKISESGGKLIQCVNLGKLAPYFAPTLIKMDIEGAEVGALAGAADMIRRYRPDLAVALYHEADHLWRIPRMVQAWNLGYKIYIRTHEYNSFGTTMYAFQR